MLALLALNRPVGSLYGAIPWPSIAMTVSTRGDLATSPLSRGHMSSDCPAAALDERLAFAFGNGERDGAGLTSSLLGRFDGASVSKPSFCQRQRHTAKR